MIRVLLVDDSRVGQEFLAQLINAEENCRVIGVANDGEEAIVAVKQWKPDVVLMDIHMPKMDGLTATRKIMETDPVPIVVVSGSTQTRELANTFRALEAGALAVVQKPAGFQHPDHAKSRKELLETLKLMAEVKVIRRWPTRGLAAVPEKVPLPKTEGPIQIVAIGASTGGPPVLQTILSQLTRDFPVPILIVQHIASGFSEGFVQWLQESSGFPVEVAQHGGWAHPGRAYVAPYGFHMKVQSNGKIVLIAGSAENGHCPSVSILFRSVAENYGKNAVGILLTGMGNDGAEELKLMKNQGAVTLVQDKESSVVFGMPGEAVRCDAAKMILPPERMPEVLENLLNLKSKGGMSHEIPKQQ